MTREEAIYRLKNMAWLYGSTEREQNIEAVNMAIEALEVKTQSDLISRADAITQFCEFGTKLERNGKLLITMVDAKYAFIKTLESLPIINGVEVVRCKDCRHATECHKSVQYTRNEPNTVTIGYSPIEWCSRGEGREE